MPNCNVSSRSCVCSIRAFAFQNENYCETQPIQPCRAVCAASISKPIRQYENKIDVLERQSCSRIGLEIDAAHDVELARRAKPILPNIIIRLFILVATAGPFRCNISFDSQMNCNENVFIKSYRHRCYLFPPYLRHHITDSMPSKRNIFGHFGCAQRMEFLLYIFLFLLNVLKKKLKI